MKATKSNLSGSSLKAGSAFTATPAELIVLANKLGAKYEEQNNGLEKYNFYFMFETEFGQPFSVYDYMYGRGLHLDQEACFNIGGFEGLDVERALAELEDGINFLTLI